MSAYPKANLASKLFVEVMGRLLKQVAMETQKEAEDLAKILAEEFLGETFYVIHPVSAFKADIPIKQVL